MSKLEETRTHAADAILDLIDHCLAHGSPLRQTELTDLAVDAVSEHSLAVQNSNSSNDVVTTADVDHGA